MTPSVLETLTRLLLWAGNRGWMDLEVTTATGILDILALLDRNDCPDAHQITGMVLVAKRATPSAQRLELAQACAEFDNDGLCAWVDGLDLIQALLDEASSQMTFAYLDAAPRAHRTLLLALAVTELRMVDHASLKPGPGLNRWLEATAPGWLQRHQGLAPLLRDKVPESLLSEFNTRMAALGRRVRGHLLTSRTSGPAGMKALLGLDPPAISEVLVRMGTDFLGRALQDPSWKELKDHVLRVLPKGAAMRLEEGGGLHPYNPESIRHAQKWFFQILLHLGEEGIIGLPCIDAIRAPAAYLAKMDQLVFEHELASLDEQETMRLLALVDRYTLTGALAEVSSASRDILYRRLPESTVIRMEQEVARMTAYGRGRAVDPYHATYNLIRQIQLSRERFKDPSNQT